MKQRAEELASKESYNITDQAGNELIVVELEDVVNLMIEFAKQEAIEAFKAWESNIIRTPFKTKIDYIKERFTQKQD